MSDTTSTNSQNPVELFDLYVAHVGINATNPEEAEKIARQLSALMGIPTVEQPPSFFAGTLVEVMKNGGRGTNGHIGFHVNDIPAAEKYFAERGLEVDETSRRLNPDGSTFLVYFKDEIAGFALHLTMDK
jgi:hypothetical protein